MAFDRYATGRISNRNILKNHIILYLGESLRHPESTLLLCPELCAGTQCR